MKLPTDLLRLIHSFAASINTECDCCGEESCDLELFNVYELYEHAIKYICNECVESWIVDEGDFCGDCGIWGNYSFWVEDDLDDVIQFCYHCQATTCFRCGLREENFNFCGCSKGSLDF